MSKILVIEDDTAVRENLIELLSEEGYEAIGAQDGEEGVQKVWEELPDLIICDIMMPKLDGFGVLAHVSRDIHLAGIPFLFLTARVAREDLRKGMEMGADDYITKPFKRSEVLKAITTRLGRLRRLEALTEKKLSELSKTILTDLPHELMTPLSVTIGFSEVLSEQVDFLDREDIRRLARDIHTSAHHLLRLVENSLLINDLLMLNSNMGPKGVSLENLDAYSGPGSYMAAPLIEISENKAKLAGRAADLVVKVQPVILQINEQHLEKILDELLDNAFKFSKPGSQVSVEGAVIPAPPQPVRIPSGAGGAVMPGGSSMREPENTTGHVLYRLRIGDHGRGMTAEQIHQVHNYLPLDRHHYGQHWTGLGLVLVHQICMLYHGSIHIQSIPGEGTLVDVLLPVQP